MKTGDATAASHSYNDDDDEDRIKAGQTCLYPYDAVLYQPCNTMLAGRTITKRQVKRHAGTSINPVEFFTVYNY
jgi:hypothetical protein